MFLLELSALDDTDAAVTLRFASGAYDGDQYTWQPRLKQPALFAERAPLPWLGIGETTSAGEAELINADGGLNYLADYALDGRKVTVYEVRDGVTKEAVLTSTVTRSRVSRDSVRLTLRSPRERFADPYPQDTYAGDGTDLEGGSDDIKGQPKPIVFGVVKNGSAVLTAPSKQIYQACNDSGTTIDAVYDRGVALTDGGDYSDLATLQSTAPSSGEYRAFEGYFRLGSTPDGTVTFDATGKSESLIRNFQEIVYGINETPVVELQYIFQEGEAGGVYTIASDDSDKIYQDAAKTTLADAADDPIRVVEPTYGSGDTTAPDDASRPLLKDPSGDANTEFDNVDDDLQVPVTGQGYLFIATTQGMYWGEYDFSVDTSIGDPAFNPRFPVVGWCAIDRVLTAAEISALKSYFRQRGALEFGDAGAATSIQALIRRMHGWNTLETGDWDTSAITNARGVFRQTSNITTVNVSGWDVSNFDDVTGIFSFAGFTSLDISTWDLSSLTDATAFCDSCNNLTSISVGSAFDNSPCVEYDVAFQNCALDQQSVNDILVSIDNAGTSNGTLEIDGGTNAAPSGAGATAVSNLEGRGWTVNTN